MYSTINGYEILQQLKLVIICDMRGILVDPQIEEFKYDSYENIEPGEIDIDNFRLSAIVESLAGGYALFDYNDDDDDEGINAARINVQLYWDEDRKAVLVRFEFNMRESDGINGCCDWTDWRALLRQKMNIKTALLRKARNVLTGSPIDSVTVTSEIKELYEECFFGL